MANKPITFERTEENDAWFGLEPEHCRDFDIDMNVYQEGDDTYLAVYHRYDDDPDFTAEPFLTVKITPVRGGS